MYKQGSDLKAGEHVSLVSGENGISTVHRPHIVTNLRDKRGNALVVDTTSGEASAASPLSVWRLS